MVESFLDFVKSLPGQRNVRNLNLEELDQEAGQFGRITNTDGRSYYSNVRNRSAGISVVFGSDSVASRNLNGRQQAIRQHKDRTLQQVREYLKRAPLIRVQRTVGDNAEFNPKCNLYLSVQRGRQRASGPSVEPHPA